METKPTRRGFLATAGAAAATLAAAGQGWLLPAALGEEAAKKKEYPFKLGLASYTTRKFSLDQTLAMSKRVGLDWICLKSFHLELNASPDDIAKAVEKVKAAGMVLYGGGVIVMKNEAEVHQAFDYAKAAGMTTIVGVPMPEVLPLVNEKVKQFDILVAIHNHGPGDKVYPTPESIIERIKDLDQRIGLCIDIGHTLRIGADPVRDADRFADRLLDVHIKDVTAPTAAGQTVEIGRGVIDIPAFLRVLLKNNYSRVVSFEYEKDPDDPLAGLAESVGYVRGVLAAI
ncbi:MAG: sugar phosphate isomerase/epimerase [Pirellulales bacterium]|nr:sugar phosphate isomerase/epimerase [Pirellulales bacterium]